MFVFHYWKNIHLYRLGTLICIEYSTGISQSVQMWKICTETCYTPVQMCVWLHQLRPPSFIFLNPVLLSVLPLFVIFFLYSSIIQTTDSHITHTQQNHLHNRLQQRFDSTKPFAQDSQVTTSIWYNEPQSHRNATTRTQEPHFSDFTRTQC
jgi:hypothetical protein